MIRWRGKNARKTCRDSVCVQRYVSGKPRNDISSWMFLPIISSQERWEDASHLLKPKNSTGPENFLRLQKKTTSNRASDVLAEAQEALRRANPDRNPGSSSEAVCSAAAACCCVNISSDFTAEGKIPPDGKSRLC